MSNDAVTLLGRKFTLEEREESDGFLVESYARGALRVTLVFNGLWYARLRVHGVVVQEEHMHASRAQALRKITERYLARHKRSKEIVKATDDALLTDKRLATEKAEQRLELAESRACIAFAEKESQRLGVPTDEYIATHLVTARRVYDENSHRVRFLVTAEPDDETPPR